MSKLRLVPLLAFALVTVAFVATLRPMSLSVNGTRYFWLDDDQMISMRYARNLAHGEGLVWNPGERVEGYTNPGWTLIEAALHLLPIADAKMALAVKVVSWLLACGVVLLAGRLMQQLLPGDALAAAFVVLVLALCRDLLFWAVNGFDTTLVTFVFLLVIVRLVDERTVGPRVFTYVLFGTLPIIRSDAYYVWAAAAAVALGTSRDRRREIRWLAASLVMPAAHLGWRHWYYGDWLPNTFYVKASVGGVRWVSAVAYLKGFVAHYAAPILVAIVGAWRAPGNLPRWLFASGLAGLLYVCAVGADMYFMTRFLAYYVPVLLVLAAFSAVTCIQDRWMARAVLTAVGLSVLFQIGVNGPSQFARLASDNGLPDAAVVLAVVIRDNTPPDTTVAVVAAGVVPYFSQRPAMDIMGLTDRYVAHLPPRPEGQIGHSKYDVGYTLGRHPDVVVPMWEHDLTDPTDWQWPAAAALANNDVFLADYSTHRRAFETPQNSMWLYVSARSPEAARLNEWRVPVVSR